ncbi:iron-containing redox enzyme family protein [Streptomyces sp. NPDC086023]|uniref:iron-containing redox enzyme family protein n=1 Tax=Streptomyces sp. NPDC086023 TaxID=3365746 RepID=UPI0037D03384
MSRERLEKLAADGMERLFRKVPKAREFHAGEWIDRDYYRRHLVETVLRIRLNNEVDAYGLYKIGYKDNRLASILAQYLAEENNHEGMFLRDLKHFGLSKGEVDAMRVYPSTEYLMGYMYFSINQEGPIPTMVWNWLVEWYSDRYNQIITTNAAETYGLEMVKGSQAHLDYDDEHDHDDLMWSAVDRAVKGWADGDFAAAERHLVNFVDLIGLYFTELYEDTVGQSAE